MKCLLRGDPGHLNYPELMLPVLRKIWEKIQEEVVNIVHLESNNK